jgi:nucleotide-binding universal stress UspA family protein
MELGRRDVERIVEDYVETFEEALLEKVDLEEPALRTLLLALDRSNQDELTLALGSQLARRHSAEIVVTGGFPDAIREEAERYLEKAQGLLSGEGVKARAVWISGGECFEKILRAVSEVDADLVILPSPYFRELESLGEDSIGTNLEVLLSRSPVPLLVVREPTYEASAVLNRISLAIFDDSPLGRASAEWALLLSRGSRLRVLALVEEEFVEIMERVVAKEGITEEIGRRLSHELIPLVSAVLRGCDKLDVHCDVDYVTGDVVEVISTRFGQRPGLIVLRGYRRDDRPAEKVARDVILRSRVPVLVVKGG